MEDAAVVGELGVEDIEELATLTEFLEIDVLEIGDERRIECLVDSSAVLGHRQLLGCRQLSKRREPWGTG